jgi:hypothetical protein
VWLGPLLVTLTTNWAKDAFPNDPTTAVRVGFSPVLLVLAVGFGLMFLLKKETGAKGIAATAGAAGH